jgi:hypothetical protein
MSVDQFPEMLSRDAEEKVLVRGFYAVFRECLLEVREFLRGYA